MPIGSSFPVEWRTITEPQTGSTLRQLTSAPAFSYPLYYFVDSITPDNRYLVYHSERGGWVQLYRLDDADHPRPALPRPPLPGSGTPLALFCGSSGWLYSQVCALNVSDLTEK